MYCIVSVWGLPIFAVDYEEFVMPLVLSTGTLEKEKESACESHRLYDNCGSFPAQT